MIKILIADDHMLIREGLKKVLNTAPEIVISAEANNASEVMEALQKEIPDVVVLDISLPGKSGLDLLSEIKASHPKLPVLMLSMHPEERYAVRALKAGAAGYVTKETAADQLIPAIRKVVQGRKHISQTLSEKLALNLENHSDKPHELLSDREFQVFQLLVVGETVRQISEKLSLSMSTVNTYRTRILQKMNMDSDAQLIHYAIRSGITE